MTTYPNWFNYAAKANFEYHLAEFADKQKLNFLQIGAFTGDASLWMLENILTDKSSILYDVDTWKGSPDEEIHTKMDFEDVYNTYLAKTGYANRRFYRGKSVDYLLSRGQLGPVVKYDFIYIDGDHTASAVLDDAVLSWQYLKSGGIMAFDDYTWHHPSGEVRLEPKPSINFFTTIKGPELDVLEVNDQVWLRKK